MTGSDWVFLGIFSGGLLAVIASAEVFRKAMNWSSEATRKIVHMLVGVLIAATPFLLDSMWPMLFLGGLFAIINYIAIKKHYLNGMHSIHRQTFGTVFYPVSFFILTAWLWHQDQLVLVTAVLIMAIPDALASIVGDNIRQPIPIHFGPEKKSVQGSLAMFVSSFLIVLLCLHLFPQLGPAPTSVLNTLWIAGVVALLATAGEMVSVRGSDNLTVPLTSAFAMFYLLHQSSAEATQFTIGMILALIIAVASYKLRFLTGGGSVALLILGTLVFGIGGWAFAAPILGFFVISSLLSKLGKKRKNKLLTVFEKSGCRDAGQVLANGGVAGITILAWYFSQNDFAYFLYVASLAAVTADTWGTEIGVLAKTPPRSVLTFRNVPLGTSGGITLIGSAGALTGAALIALISLLTTSGHISFSAKEFLFITLAGFLGSIVDSIVGATIQGQYQCPKCQKITERKTHCSHHQTKFIRGWKWMNNDAVNAFCAAAGSGLMCLLSLV